MTKWLITYAVEGNLFSDVESGELTIAENNLILIEDPKGEIKKAYHPGWISCERMKDE